MVKERAVRAWAAFRVSGGERVAGTNGTGAFLDYDGFVAKFEPKRTTDDCMTPPEVYEAVLTWAEAEYGIDREKVVRPFWPGGDFEAAEYPDGCCVVDNPPFSILARIMDFYAARGIPYLIFAPNKTLLGSALRRPGACCLMCGASVTYANGAKVSTSFVTSMDAARVRTAPDLLRAVEEADLRAREATRKELPRYRYPDEVMRFSDLENLSRGGVDFRLHDGEFARKAKLDCQGDKMIFGGGVMMCSRKTEERQAAERRAARVFELSERERAEVAYMDGVLK